MLLISRLIVTFVLTLFAYLVSGNAMNVNRFRKEEVLLVAPILAADKNSRARIVETAKDFPIVRLISTDNNTSRTSGVNHTVEPQPIYVENSEDGYSWIFMIKSTHALKKRDVYSIDTVSVPASAGVQPKEETVIIVPNSGVNNYPYGSNYYPSNSRYGTNPGTTVIVSNPDGNYNNGYGSRYFPNTIPKYG